mmetsp:Transcript_13007/g.20944  ORF Transcript_13007/g.20944 Transcript_13007/m.20944 type:complete len:92 (-) Transcript_13007:74-349(-)
MALASERSRSPSRQRYGLQPPFCCLLPLKSTPCIPLCNSEVVSDGVASVVIEVAGSPDALCFYERKFSRSTFGSVKANKTSMCTLNQGIST